MEKTAMQKTVGRRAWFSVLGPVRAWRDGAEIDLGTPQQRSLLTLLLVQAGRPVTMDEIIDVLWSGSAPPTAVNVVHRYVSRLRRLLPDGVLVRCSGGYRLELDADGVDVLAFRRLVDEAASVEPADPVAALDLLVRALRLRHGPVGAGIRGGVRAAATFVEVEDEVTAVVLRAAGLALDLGVPQQVLPVLRAATAAAPFDEALQSVLLRALAMAGRTAEALSRYAEFRATLTEELGVDPGAAVVAIHQQILCADPTTAAPPAPAMEPRAEVMVPRGVRPAQIPTDLPTFAARTGHLERLTSFLRGDGCGIATARIAVIAGMGGIGKTTLAVRCAHRLADNFPDGQLYVNMRGFDPSVIAVRPEDALRGFLTALGVPDSGVPADLDAQVSLYRSLIARQRMIVVLDNVRDAEQARPLLPGGPGSVAIVTSRDPLAGLIVREGAWPFVLDLLSRPEAEAVLAHRISADRMTADPGAIDQIVDSCGGLPLALALFSARAATHPQFSLRQLVAELDASRHRLDCFGRMDSEHDLRAVFSWSYRLLGAAAGRLFRLLALHPGPTFGVTAIASLLGHGARQGAELLAELSRANLVTEYAPGRFRIHDLVRAYSAELMHADEPAAAQRESTERLLDHYLHSSLAAAVLLNPHRVPATVSPQPPAAGVTVQRFAGYDEALGWFVEERPALLELVDAATSAHADPYVWQIAWAMENFLQRHYFWAAWEKSQQLALDAARRAGDMHAEARVQHSLGMIYSDRAMNLPRRCHVHLAEASRLFAACGDLFNQANVLLRVAEMLGAENRGAEQRRYVRQALALYHDLEVRGGAGRAPDYLAIGYERLGEYARALPYALQSLDLLQAAGDRHREATAWSTMRGIHAGLSNWVQALAAGERSVLLYQELGDHFLAAQELADSAQRYEAAGRHLSARTALRRALEIFTHLDSPSAAGVRAALERLDRGARRSEAVAERAGALIG